MATPFIFTITSLNIGEKEEGWSHGFLYGVPLLSAKAKGEGHYGITGWEESFGGVESNEFLKRFRFETAQGKVFANSRLGDVELETPVMHESSHIRWLEYEAGVMVVLNSLCPDDQYWTPVPPPLPSTQDWLVGGQFPIDVTHMCSTLDQWKRRTSLAPLARVRL